jgi:hypothetical protein
MALERPQPWPCELQSLRVSHKTRLLVLVSMAPERKTSAVALSKMCVQLVRQSPKICVSHQKCALLRADPSCALLTISCECAGLTLLSLHCKFTLLYAVCRSDTASSHC